jgi:hypothetical protein
MEERGAVPDFIVELPPESWGKRGTDPQVEKAVSVLIGELPKETTP